MHHHHGQNDHSLNLAREEEKGKEGKANTSPSCVTRKMSYEKTKSRTLGKLLLGILTLIICCIIGIVLGLTISLGCLPVSLPLSRGVSVTSGRCRISSTITALRRSILLLRRGCWLGPDLWTAPGRDVCATCCDVVPGTRTRPRLKRIARSWSFT